MGEPGAPEIKVSSLPLNSGKISPYLCGSFIELLDDLVPGMWAEMLNDRGFEGISRLSSFFYYTGEPNFCDKEWGVAGNWSYDSEEPFNGSRSLKLTAAKKSASVFQPDLYVKKGSKYQFSGHFRSDSPDARAAVKIKTLLPDGKWLVIASEKLPKLTGEWSNYTCTLTSTGTTDKAVFELEVKGSGSVWADRVSLMPTDNLKGWRKDVIQVIKDAKPGMVRWGGSVVDPGGYRWKGGIGERDSRTPFQIFPGRRDSNDVGLDEFLQFCELTGVEPLICVSFSDGPENAKDMVEYCNSSVTTEWGKKRAANGHSKPYNVKYWQVGNELGDEEYAKGCRAIFLAIREVNPKAILLSSYPTKDVVQSVGDLVDFVSPHHYTPDVPSCDNDINENMKVLREMYPDRDIKLGVTEWNYTGGMWGLGRGNLLTLNCALHNARYLNVLHRHADAVGLACRSNMTNSCGSGMIQTNESGIYKAPSYYAMKLYADHTKPIALEVNGTPEGLDVSACRSEDGKLLTLFVVNTTGDPVEFSLNLNGMGDMESLGGEIVCDTLDQRQPDLQNHWKSPDRVRTLQLPLAGQKIIAPALSVMALDYTKK